MIECHEIHAYWSDTELNDLIGALKIAFRQTERSKPEIIECCDNTPGILLIDSKKNIEIAGKTRRAVKRQAYPPTIT